VPEGVPPCGRDGDGRRASGDLVVDGSRDEDLGRGLRKKGGVRMEFDRDRG
jgi:hypothetical protein